MRQGALPRLFVLLLVCNLVACQVQRARFCQSLFRCLNTSYLCPVLFAYYNCQAPTDVAPPCGESSVTGRASEYAMPRVVGGVNAEEGEFPWTVHVRDENNRATMCGGTIVESNVVITAAHCVRSFVNRPRSIEVGYGSVVQSRLIYVKASRVIIHPNYNMANNDNDIAIIILSQAFPLNITTNLRSACLPQRGREYPTAAECVVTGWGTLADGGLTIPDILQKAAVPLVTRDTCQRSYASFANILVSDRQLCAGYFNQGGIDACRGDSGGPLVCPDGDTWVLYGVVSVGNGCARPRFPGVYAHVPEHIDWIRSQIY